MPQRDKRFSSIGSIPKFKVVLLGEAGVGKSALFMRMKDDIFVEGMQPTLGIESCSRIVNVDGDSISFQVWDTAGVEKYRTLTRNYYRNTHAVLLVYSVDSPATLHYLSKWIQDTHDSAPHALKFLVGNKADLENLIPRESVEEFGAAHDCESAHFVSAKTGQGLEKALSKIGEKLLETYKTPPLMESLFDDTINIHAHNSESKSSWCC